MRLLNRGPGQELVQRFVYTIGEDEVTLFVSRSTFKETNFIREPQAEFAPGFGALSQHCLPTFD